MRTAAAGGALAIFAALCAAACGNARGESRERVAPALSALPAPAVTAAPAASTAVAASATVAAAPAPVDRPSTRAARPPGADPAQWQRIFDTYGRLLDLDYLLDDYHRRFPDRTRVVTLGTTHQGRAVKALLLADRPDDVRGRPSVLLNGAHHGDEPLSADIVLDAIDTLLRRAGSDPRMRRYLEELAIWCVPMVNPDGFAQFMVDFGAGRKNGRDTRGEGGRRTLSARGVDLNRNYPFRWGSLGERGGRSRAEHRFYRGPEAASEPEVRAMVALSDREHFVASISYHIGTVALLAPYTIEGVDNPYPNEAWLVAEDVARRMPKNPEKSLFVRKNLYPVDGTDQDYHRAAHGTVALLWEAASRSWETAHLRSRTLSSMRPSWEALFDRYLDGPAVEGRVRDREGRPVAARVDVAEMPVRAGEVWLSRCPDGFFGRFLPGFGRFTVRVTPEGRAPVEQAVEVTREKGRAVVEIVVDGGARCLD